MGLGRGQGDAGLFHVQLRCLQVLGRCAVQQGIQLGLSLGHLGLGGGQFLRVRALLQGVELGLSLGHGGPRGGKLLLCRSGYRLIVGCLGLLVGRAGSPEFHGLRGGAGTGLPGDLVVGSLGFLHIYCRRLQVSLGHENLFRRGTGQERFQRLLSADQVVPRRRQFFSRRGRGQVVQGGLGVGQARLGRCQIRRIGLLGQFGQFELDQAQADLGLGHLGPGVGVIQPGQHSASLHPVAYLHRHLSQDAAGGEAQAHFGGWDQRASAAGIEDQVTPAHRGGLDRLLWRGRLGRQNLVIVVPGAAAGQKHDDRKDKEKPLVT